MSDRGLTDIQLDIAARFHRHVDAIPESFGKAVDEYDAESNVLRLALVPAVPDRAGMEMEVFGEECTTTFAGWSPIGNGSGSCELPERVAIEEFIEAVVRGSVTEEIWTWRSRTVRHIYRFRLRSRVYEDDQAMPSPFLVLCWYLLRGGEVRRVSYKSYLES